MNADFVDFRKRLWHLRHGGRASLRQHREQAVPSLRTINGNPDDVTAKMIGRGKRKSLGFIGQTILSDKPRRADLTVAVILDDFSLSAFAFEWNQIPLERDNWRRQLATDKPDFLFVESAWAGNGGEWRYQLTGQSGVKEEFRQLIAYCHERSIPTVFWNKEDPPHYDDFLGAARLFDYVFTSDGDRLPHYLRDLDHNRVAVLQFAAQPSLHNPVRPRNGWHERDVAFGGMYFADKYPERRQQLELLLNAAQAAGKRMKYGLEIFSRHAGEGDKYRFPDAYQEYVRGSLSYDQMLSAYKAYKLFLNVNSVTSSPTMCARRIFEITASGTSVISTPSVALENMWKSGEQFIVGSGEDAEELIAAIHRNPELSDRQLHLAQRRIWSTHTYSHRVESIVSTVLPQRSQLGSPSAVSVIVSSIRPGQIENIFRTAGSFVGVDVELVLSTHGFSPDRVVLEDLREKYGVGSLVHLTQPKDRSLGACLRNCVSEASGDYVTKMDDDDFYGEFYLLDLVHSLMFTGADIVGKQAHYMYLSARDVTMLRFPDREHRFSASVMGPTITGRREVFDRVPFSDVWRGEDTAFLKSVREAGGSVYSTDRFNYAQYRGSASHTWKISDDRLLTTGDVAFFGRPQPHIYF